jgi:hypothetical protein
MGSLKGSFLCHLCFAMIKLKKAMRVFFQGFILNTNMSVEVMA